MRRQVLRWGSGVVGMIIGAHLYGRLNPNFHFHDPVLILFAIGVYTFFFILVTAWERKRGRNNV